MAETQDTLDYMDLSEVPNGPPLIPVDDYHLKVVDAESRATKEGNGAFLNYRAVVQSGPFAGRSIFGMWTTKNAAGKQDNVWRTKRDWKILGYTPVGAPKISEIIGLEGYAKVGTKQRFGTEDEQENTVKSWIKSI